MMMNDRKLLIENKVDEERLGGWWGAVIRSKRIIAPQQPPRQLSIHLIDL